MTGRMGKERLRELVIGNSIGGRLTQEEAHELCVAVGAAETHVEALEARVRDAEAEARQDREGYERVCVTMARMHAAALGEVRGPVVGLVEDVEAVRLRAEKAEARVRRLEEALGALLEQTGWHGSGEHDRDEFYCEHCKQSHEDYTLVPHNAGCPVAVARAALKETP